MRHRLSIGQCATLACVFEATAPKPGNVHRGADFDGLTYPDLLVSAAVIGPIVDLAAKTSVGKTILAAVQATRSAIATNSNLGAILLIAPLAAVPREQTLAAGVQDVLSGLTTSDSRDVYEAICTACAGGLGTVDSADVAGDPPTDLVAAMRLAQQRDLVARQYANGFEDVLGFVAPTIRQRLAAGLGMYDAIVVAQLETMSRYPDSLIARKCGPEIAQRAADHAAAVLAAGPPESEDFWTAAADFDFWLRGDGHRRNPGTTADLLAAGLFTLLRDDILNPPFR